MFKIDNNIELRNLEEQVQKNKEDIANHYAIDRAMSNLGIKVVGQVATSTLLPDPTTYQGEYGDTYAVGSKPAVDAGNATYDYYVYTRPDPNSGQPNNYWLNVGKISIAGPQGIQGIQGEKGDTGASTKWYYGDDLYTTANEGDFLLTSAGLVYEYINNQWIYKTNIKGPQGIQGIQGQKGDTGEVGPVGPKGDTGDAGGFINIRGILNNTDQLPLPSTLDDRTIAYLVGASEPYDLYIQIGETSDDAVWNNVGPLNVATLVTSGGVYQNIWNADTKLDKDTHVTTYNQVYVKAANGGQGHINVTKQTVADAVVQRQSDGNIYVPATPAEGVDAASKQYVDTQVGKKVNTAVGVGPYVYCRYNGEDNVYQVYPGDTYAGNANGIPRYVGSRLFAKTPSESFHVANKAYVDNNVGTKFYKHTITFSITYKEIESENENTEQFTVAVMSPVSNQVTGINNNTWFYLPTNSTVIEGSGNLLHFHMTREAMTFTTTDTNSFTRTDWEMWRDYQEGWPIIGAGDTVRLTFISDTITSL